MPKVQSGIHSPRATHWYAKGRAEILTSRSAANIAAHLWKNEDASRVQPVDSRPQAIQVRNLGGGAMLEYSMQRATLVLEKGIDCVSQTHSSQSPEHPSTEHSQPPHRTIAWFQNLFTSDSQTSNRTVILSQDEGGPPQLARNINLLRYGPISPPTPDHDQQSHITSLATLMPHPQCSLYPHQSAGPCSSAASLRYL